VNLPMFHPIELLDASIRGVDPIAFVAGRRPLERGMTPGPPSRARSESDIRYLLPPLDPEQ
jgi:hypothetical protein